MEESFIISGIAKNVSSFTAFSFVQGSRMIRTNVSLGLCSMGSECRELQQAAVHLPAKGGQ